MAIVIASPRAESWGVDATTEASLIEILTYCRARA
jgi:hypothetical protein